MSLRHSKIVVSIGEDIAKIVKEVPEGKIEPDEQLGIGAELIERMDSVIQQGKRWGKDQSAATNADLVKKLMPDLRSAEECVGKLPDAKDLSNFVKVLSSRVTKDNPCTSNVLDKHLQKLAAHNNAIMKTSSQDGVQE
eukprot:12398792-Karenia_brevis.AAC.1